MGLNSVVTQWRKRALRAGAKFKQPTRVYRIHIRLDPGTSVPIAHRIETAKYKSHPLNLLTFFVLLMYFIIFFEAFVTFFDLFFRLFPLATAQ